MTLALQDALPRLIRLARTEDAAEDVHLVGGWVRDTLLGRETREIDLTAANAEAFASRAGEVLETRVVALAGPHPLFRVPLRDGHIDVSPREGTLDQDLGRRDFTVNAMAVPLHALSEDGAPAAAEIRAPVIDLHDGLADLEARVLRAVHDGVFEDDPLRAWRGPRLVAELGFALDPATTDLIAACVEQMEDGARRPAPERVSTELLRLFGAERSTEAIRLMEATGLLAHTFPELREGYGLEQRPWHAFDVYRHQLAAFEAIDLLCAPSPPADEEGARTWTGFWRGVEWNETRWGRLPDLLEEHRAAIKLATLLHDVGKPRTITVEADGRTRFFGHAEVGAEMVEQRLRAWRFPSAFIERVRLLIEQHLRPGQVASPGQPPTPKALHRFHDALGDATADLCLLFLADSLATAPDQVRERWRAYVRHVQRIIEWRPAHPEQGPRLIDGHDVMRETGLAPGPALGRVMTAIDEATAVGEVRSRDEALRLAASLARDLEVERHA